MYKKILIILSLVFFYHSSLAIYLGIDNLEDKALEAYNKACNSAIDRNDITAIDEVDSDHDYVSYSVSLSTGGSVMLSLSYLGHKQTAIYIDEVTCSN